MNFIKSIILVVIALTATANIVFSQTTNPIQKADSIEIITVKVKGVTCSMDLKMIAANVEKLEGVNSCKTGKKGTTTTFKVNMNTSLVTEKEIHSAIENTGSCENPDERPYKIKQ
jgi:copper chaperone CopZ